MNDTDMLSFMRDFFGLRNPRSMPEPPPTPKTKTTEILASDDLMTRAEKIASVVSNGHGGGYMVSMWEPGALAIQIFRFLDGYAKLDRAASKDTTPEPTDGG